MQTVLTLNGDYSALDDYFLSCPAKRFMLVHGKTYPTLKIARFFASLSERYGVQFISFSNVKPNPLYESVLEGVELFKATKCGGIVAVGGGSIIDVAKCVKLFATMPQDANYLCEMIIPNDIPLMAVPTTAGSGSEATRFAVIYYEGEKQSIAHDSCVPELVVMDTSVLESLPDYQKKSTMMDALCHAIEACWSVNSTDESKALSMRAIRSIMANKDAYLAGDTAVYQDMLTAAYTAGQAINISQTTAGHAMSYKLTSLYNIAHGHAVALCVSKLWPFMVERADKCTDPRGADYLGRVLLEIAGAMGFSDAMGAAAAFGDMVEELGLTSHAVKDEGDYAILRDSVNPVRMRNFPIALDYNTIDMLYRQIVDGNRKG